MSSARAGASGPGAILAGVILILACAALSLSAFTGPARGFSGDTRLGGLAVVDGAKAATAVKSTAKKKRVRSCNKGDDKRKSHAAAAVDAWAVACEFPPRSQTIPSGALQAAASVAAILGG
jgi:hypothetical protein